MKKYILLLGAALILFSLFFYKLIVQNSFFLTPLNRISVKNESVSTPSVTPKPTINEELTGWVAAWDNDKAMRILPQVMDKLDMFNPMLYRVMPDSTLGRHSVRNRGNMLELARQNNIPIAPVVTDESDYSRIHELITNYDVQEEFISQLIDEAEKEKFDGWSIDIEKLKSGDKDDFTNFIKNLATHLHENNLHLFVIVYARVEKESYDPALAHDYQALGQVADQVQIMTYNYSNDLTKPGGQTPLSWFRKVLDFAVKTIPREKILVSLSTHGYDWSDGEVTGVTYQKAKEIIDKYDAEIRYDERASSSVASYEDNGGNIHGLWFEDAKTIIDKVNIAKKEYRIGKFAFWRIGAEDPQLWNSL